MSSSGPLVDKDGATTDSSADVSTNNSKSYGITDFPLPVFMIIIVELCERFTYYGLRSLLTKFLHEKLGYDEPTAKSIYSFYTSLAYFMPILGGFLADSVLGRFKTISIFTIFYLCGVSLLSWDARIESKPLAFIALILVAIGTGGIKPCVSVFGAESLRTNNPTAIGKYFSVFYMCINIGSVASTLLIPVIRVNYGYFYAFLTPCIFLTIAIIIFLSGSALYNKTKPSGSVYSRVISIIFAASKSKKRVRLHNLHADPILLSRRTLRRDMNSINDPVDNGVIATQQQQQANPSTDLIGLEVSNTSDNEQQEQQSSSNTSYGYLDYAKILLHAEHIEEVKAVVTLLPIFGFMIIFWTLFDQQGSTFILQADKMDRFVYKWNIEGAQVSALNSISILMLVPLFQNVIYPILYKLGFEVKHLNRMVVGMMLCALSFCLCAYNDYQIEQQGVGKVHIYYQIPQYLIMAIAEVLISVTGIEFAFSQAPKSMKGTIQSFWCVPTALGDLFAGILFRTVVFKSPYYFSLLCSGLMFCNMLVFLPVAVWFNKKAARFYENQSRQRKGLHVAHEEEIDTSSLPLPLDEDEIVVIDNILYHGNIPQQYGAISDA